MSKLELFVADLQYYFSGNNCIECNIIRKHSKNLSKLGDVSFPIKLNNWNNLLDTKTSEDDAAIFDYKNKCLNLEEHCNELQKNSLKWSLKINRILVISPNAYVFLERSFLGDVLKEVLDLSREYGIAKCLNKCYTLKIGYIENTLKKDLTFLRLTLLSNIGNNFIRKFTIIETDSLEIKKEITLNKSFSDGSVLCGPVLNEKGLKSATTADELYK